MSINVNLTNGQFYELNKDSEFLTGMSYEGVCAILDFIAENEESDTVVDWTAYFIEAGEYDEVSLISDFSYLVDDENINWLNETLEKLRDVHTVIKLDNGNYIVI